MSKQATLSKWIIPVCLMFLLGMLATPIAAVAQNNGVEKSTGGTTIQRLYFDHRGRVDGVEGDTLVINDRTYKVLSTVTLLSMDQKPLAGLSYLKAGDFIGFTVDDERRINTVYLLSPPKKHKNKQ